MRNYKYSSTGIILSIKEIIQTMQNESEKYLLFALWPTGFILLIPALLNESNQLFDILSLFWISLSVAVIIL
jgi:amino acid permease